MTAASSAAAASDRLRGGSGGPRPLAVGVEELRRAWTALARGDFATSRGQDPALAGDEAAGHAGPVWAPAPEEQVVAVVGCVGSAGASTLGLAMAMATALPARLLECSPPAVSGLAGAATAELGITDSGWVEGRRGERLLIQRPALPFPTLADLPLPGPPAAAGMTLVDVGWSTVLLTSGWSWLRHHLVSSQRLVCVTLATVPALRRAEAVLGELSAAEEVVVAVLGPPRRRWPAALAACCGPGMRRLEEAGQLLSIPHDRRLALHGLDSTPLPTALLNAAAEVHASLGRSVEGSR